MQEAEEKKQVNETDAQGSATDTTAEAECDQGASHTDPPTRPVRMRWGKVVEEPPPEPEEAVSQKEETVKEEEPRKRETEQPDPLVEAVRLMLLRQEQSAAQKENADEKAVPVDAKAGEHGNDHGNGNAQIRVTEASQKSRPSSANRRARDAEEAKRKAQERRELEAADRFRAEENARMKAELEREALRRAIRKKRRREYILYGIGAFFGGIGRFFRGIRVSKKQVLAILLTLALSFLAAVILGNLLRTRVDAGGDTGESSAPEETGADTVPNFRGMAVPSVNAGIVSLEGATVKALRQEAERFLASGVSAVSLILRDSEGNLLFSAKTDDALGIESGANRDADDTVLLGIDEILSPFLERGLYVSCMLPVRYFSDGDAYSRSVLYAYETALLCEVAEAGAAEVILLDADKLLCASDEALESGSSENIPTTAEAVAELAAMARDVNGRAPATAVGIALAPEFLATNESDRYLGEIAEAFDLTLLDLRFETAEDGDLYTVLARRIDEHLYFIRRYSMRVLITAGTAEAVIVKSIDNWQEGTIPVTGDGTEE